MTDAVLDLEPIEAREKKATSGPWAADENPPVDSYLRITGGFDGDAYDDGSTRLISTHICDVIDGEDEFANAFFIAHAREDIPKLLAEVKRLRDNEADKTVKFWAHKCGQTWNKLCKAEDKVKRLRAAIMRKDTALRTAIELATDHRDELFESYVVRYKGDSDFGKLDAEGQEVVAPWDHALAAITAALAEEPS